MRSYSYATSFITLLLLISTCDLIQAQDLVRHPAINPQGTHVTYAWQGDIWLMDLEQTDSRRITIHEGEDIYPRFNPAGDRIAFSSDRYGNHDIYTIPVGSGSVKRLTWRSSTDRLTDWHKDQLYFISNRDFNTVEWDSEIQVVSENGSTPYRISDAFGDDAVISPNGKWVAFVRGSCRVAREAYRGSANLDIWLMNRKSGEFKQLTDFNGNDHMPRWQDDNTLLYLSAKDGRYNIHSLEVTGAGEAGSESKLTDETSFGIRHFDVASNGDLIYTSGLKLVHRKADGTLNELTPEHVSDYRFDPIEYLSKSSELTEFALTPNGTYSALGIHGEVFVTKNDPKKANTRNISQHSYRDRDLAWLNDSTLIFSSDRNGNYDLFLARSTDANKTELLATLKHEVVPIADSDEDETGAVVSPDGSKITYVSGSQFILADIDSKGKISNKQVLHNEWWNLPSGVSWSPDSKWIAYSQQDLYFNSEIYIRSADGKGEPINVSMHPKGDAMPMWSADGKKLAFASERNGQNYDVWFAWLSEDDWDKTKEDLEEGLYFDDEDSEQSGEEKDETVVVDIDAEGIHERLMQVTSASANEYAPVFDQDGEHIYFVSSSIETERTELYKVKWDGSDLARITKTNASPSNLTLSSDGTSLFFISNGRLAQLATASDKMESVAFRAQMVRDFEAEKRQIFDEAWSVLNKGFYDPDFHGQNFAELKEQYRPLAMAASTKGDFRDMFNLMLGQLNASHMGLYGSDRAETQQWRTGLLGIEIKPHKRGVEVLHVIPNGPADREQSKLNVGEVITHVDGIELESNDNFYRHFENRVEEQILLTVRDGRKEREVVIRPTGRLSDHLYEQWVDERAELTEKYSNGRLGYIHIRGMNMPSFERFERELMASGYGKEGILIDVRYNGGGWTTDYLMTVLNVRQHAYTIPRGATEDPSANKTKFREYYPFSERLPLTAWTKPSAALCNESSYSNAEIFSHAYKNLGIGPLIGKETFGAVISTGGRGLIDGSYVRLPFRGWYVKKTDQNMDFSGAVPDHELENTPDYRTGEDAQLKKAVEVLLEKIDADEM